jgi:uncharacterized protein
MRAWVDLTNSPHVLVLEPVIERLRGQGVEVEVTARDFAQTVALCELHGIDAEVIGHHRGSSLAGKARGLADRSLELRRWARGRSFDIAIAHGSNDLTVAAKTLGVPSATMFDYEWATVQHNVNCRLASAVVVPELIPPGRLDRYGARGKLRRYPGLKEEYYLSAFEPDPGVLDALGIDRGEPLALVRPAPEVALYHRFENRSYGEVLATLREQGQVVVLPRYPNQREEIERLGGFIVPDGAIDAPSLVAFADLVVSGGGTMNREAVALGTPVITTFEGRLGGVDEALLADGRLRRLDDVGEIVLARREGDGGAGRTRRDPQLLVDLLMSALGPPASALAVPEGSAPAG